MPSRAPKPEEKHRKKNDGRPPIHHKSFWVPNLPKQNPQVKKGLFQAQVIHGPNNSCFLDTSLELIFQTVMQDFQDFSTCFVAQESETTLILLHQMFELRKLIDIE